ncbi:MAG: hypothetical protein ACM3QW_04115 [Ignavibacteriales bacterium]
MSKKGKRPVPVKMSDKEKPLVIDPNRIKVRDTRGILLTGCGFHKDKKKHQSKYICRKKGRVDPGL